MVVAVLVVDEATASPPSKGTTAAVDCSVVPTPCAASSSSLPLREIVRTKSILHTRIIIKIKKKRKAKGIARKDLIVSTTTSKNLSEQRKTVFDVVVVVYVTAALRVCCRVVFVSPSPS